MILIEPSSISAVMRMSELTQGEKLVYSTSMMEPNSTVTSLASILGKGSMSRHCAVLEKAGLVRLVRASTGSRVLPLIPLASERALAEE